MQRLILLIIFATLMISCQAHLSKKPQVILCVIDYPRSSAICQDPKQETPTTKRIPLSEMDKAVAFRNSDWFELQNYIDNLEMEQCE